MVLITLSENACGDEVILPPPVSGEVEFLRDVYPLLRQHCFDCHRGSNPDSGVRLDHHAKLLGETDGVPLVIKGDSARSRLIHVVAGAAEDLVMPPPDAGRRLTNQEIGLLRAWIDQGLKWDETRLPDPNQAVAREHWAFRPAIRPTVPEGQTNPIDAFIAEHHQRLKLTLAPSAAKRMLIRRLYLVLHGLPPSADEVGRFLDDAPHHAWSRLVDRVLSSRHYGERIARHWLDSVRWAESEGFAANIDRPFAWRYRDYVVDSFNKDKSYAEFLRQQIAGDELEPCRDENLIATGFLAAARVSSDDLHFYRVENDMQTDIVNTLSSAVLGLTIGCSQCHDHKFDPISQRDFYRLQAFFKQGLPGNLVLDGDGHPKKLDQLARELLELDLQVRQRVLSEGFDEQPEPLRRLLRAPEMQRSVEQEQAYRPERISLNIRVAGCNGFRIKDSEKKRIDQLKKQLNELVGRASQTWGFYSPVTSPHVVTTLPMKGNFPFLHDKRRLTELRCYLLAGGRIFEPVAVVKPGWPAVFGPTDSLKIDSRPRTALADWLTSRDHPLTARVWVNRIWQMHFGRGLVDTPGNFGVRGSQPSHPWLLDWLAFELMDNNWSTKHIHRLIVTSRTWQQTSRRGAANLFIAEEEPGKTIRPTTADPENRYLWQWPRRRLEAEAIRDSMLVASGELDRAVGGPGVAVAEEASSVRRGLYLFQKRDGPPVLQALFDGPTAMSEACVKRQVSTSPLQSLYLLNNSFSTQRSRIFANRIRAIAGNDAVQQIHLAFEVALARPPDDVERREIRGFFDRHSGQGHERFRLGAATERPSVRRTEAPGDQPVNTRTMTPLELFSQALLNLNEFLYIE